MSLTKAVKWFAIYLLLTLGFTAISALGAFMCLGISIRYEGVRQYYEFDAVFSFFLFITGLFFVAVGAFIVFRIAKLTFPSDMVITFQRAYVTSEAYRYSKVQTERKYGILLILVGLTLILVAITQLYI